jgi:molybdate transport system substrate-binding protein
MVRNMRKFLVLIAALALLIPSMASADEFLVAVASNFQGPAEKIIAEFEKDTGHKANATFGSTGSFKEQIKNGSPVAIFLAADAKTPRELAADGLAKEGSIFTYAKGSLVLWSVTDGYVDAEGQVLKTGDYAHLSVADPALAPYGAAAYEFLKAWGLLEGLEKDNRLVIGKNIGQAHSNVDTGNAELGLVALSQVWENGQFTKGSGFVVPQELYPPILQDVVILKIAENDAAVQAFADYLRSDKAKAIILSYGYTLVD